MRTTGLGQAPESIPRAARELETSAQTPRPDIQSATDARTSADCPVCGDVEAEPIAVCSDFHHPTASADAVLALRCSDCGTVYLSPAVSPGSCRSPVITELGGAARQVLTSVRGIDPSRILALSVRDASEASTIAREGLDLIVLDRALEYSHAPLTLLATLRQALQPGGRIVLILRNLESPSFAVFGGRHWAGYDVPSQRAIYSIAGIRRLAGRAGLEVQSLSTVPDAACWVESCRRALEDWRAPTWIIRRFAADSIVSRGALGLVDRMFGWRQRGAILVVSLQNGGTR